MSSFLKNLENKIQEAEQYSHSFLDMCSIYYHDPNRNADGFVILMPTLYHWGKSQAESGSTQLAALKSSKDFIQNFKIIENKFTSGQIKQINQSQETLINIIERKVHAPSSIERAKAWISEKFDEHRYLIDLLKQDKSQIVVIPDTNAIISKPDPADYKEIIGKNKFNFILTPTLTKELDELKITHRNDNFRDKVKSVIKRIKGYRNQGSLIDGVKYANSITIRAFAEEPNFENIYKWLDRENQDDRLIATTLNIIAKNPNNEVILITGDINLQNKAELAQIKYLDFE